MPLVVGTPIFQKNTDKYRKFMRFCWWNMFDIIHRMGRRSFGVGLTNWSSFDEDVLKKFWLARLLRFKRPYINRLYVCASATLMLNISETKRFRGLCPIGTLLESAYGARRVEWW